MADHDYKQFHKKLIPTVSEDKIIGIRTPLLRKLAKNLYKDNRDLSLAFLQTLPHYYYEENNLHAFIIEQIQEYNECMVQTERFLPYIDNWATCDSFSPKIFKKNHEAVYAKILQWLESKHCYTIRYGMGLLLSNYLDAHFKAYDLELVANLKTEEYYVKMMQAWYFSFALIKQYDASIHYFTTQHLDKFTHNKSIQKAIESRRISHELKDYLRSLRVK